MSISSYTHCIQFVEQCVMISAIKSLERFQQQDCYCPHILIFFPQNQAIVVDLIFWFSLWWLSIRPLETKYAVSLFEIPIFITFKILVNYIANSFFCYYLSLQFRFSLSIYWILSFLFIWIYFKEVYLFGDSVLQYQLITMKCPKGKKNV